MQHAQQSNIYDEFPHYYPTEWIEIYDESLWHFVRTSHRQHHSRPYNKRRNKNQNHLGINVA